MGSPATQAVSPSSATSVVDLAAASVPAADRSCQYRNLGTAVPSWESSIELNRELVPQKLLDALRADITAVPRLGDPSITPERSRIINPMLQGHSIFERVDRICYGQGGGLLAGKDFGNGDYAPGSHNERIEKEIERVIKYVEELRAITDPNKRLQRLAEIANENGVTELMLQQIRREYVHREPKEIAEKLRNLFEQGDPNETLKYIREKFSGLSKADAAMVVVEYDRLYHANRNAQGIPGRPPGFYQDMFDHFNNLSSQDPRARNWPPEITERIESGRTLAYAEANLLVGGYDPDRTPIDVVKEVRALLTRANRLHANLRFGSISTGACNHLLNILDNLTPEQLEQVEEVWDQSLGREGGGIFGAKTLRETVQGAIDDWRDFSDKEKTNLTRFNRIFEQGPSGKSHRVYQDIGDFSNPAWRVPDPYPQGEIKYGVGVSALLERVKSLASNKDLNCDERASQLVELGKSLKPYQLQRLSSSKVGDKSLDEFLSEKIEKKNAGLLLANWWRLGKNPEDVLNTLHDILSGASPGTEQQQQRRTSLQELIFTDELVQDGGHLGKLDQLQRAYNLYCNKQIDFRKDWQKWCGITFDDEYLNRVSGKSLEERIGAAEQIFGRLETKIAVQVHDEMVAQHSRLAIKLQRLTEQKMRENSLSREDAKKTAVKELFTSQGNNNTSTWQKESEAVFEKIVKEHPTLNADRAKEAFNWIYTADNAFETSW